MALAATFTPSSAHELWFSDAPHGPHLESKKLPRLTFDFQQADAIWAFKVIGEKCGFLVWVEPGFSGKIDIRAKDEPADTLLSRVLRTHFPDFDCRLIDGRILAIAQPQNMDELLNGTPLLRTKNQTKAYRIEFIPGALLAEILQPLNPELKLQGDDDPRYLRASGSEWNLSILETDITHLQKTPQYVILTSPTPTLSP